MPRARIILYKKYAPVYYDEIQPEKTSSEIAGILRNAEKSIVYRISFIFGPVCDIIKKHG